MPQSGSITALRERLHARMASLRRGGKSQSQVGVSGGDGEAGDRDELLEERRRQRGAMREKRRKETKEKIRREEEAKGRKGKVKEKDSRAQGHQTNVRVFLLEHTLPGGYESDSDVIPCRHSYSFQTNRPHQKSPLRIPTLPSLP